jgi:hypothetical protein
MKTTFVDGTIVEPAFLNAIFDHSHDGVDDDGHSAKINLAQAAQVTGLLPLQNIVLNHRFLLGGNCYYGPAANEITVEPCFAMAANQAGQVLALQASITKKIVSGTGFQTGSGNSGLPSGVSVAQNNN